MKEIDQWVTDHDGEKCGHPSRHIYRCVRYSTFHVELYTVGSTTTIDEATFKICGVVRVNPSETEDWLLVYAHYESEPMDDFYGLYGTPELAG